MSILANCVTIHRPNETLVRGHETGPRAKLETDASVSVSVPGGSGPASLAVSMFELLKRYGLWAVFFGTMVEGDLTLLFAGVLARAGLFTFEEAFAVGLAGGFIGDSLSYLIGVRFRGRVGSLGFFVRARPRIEKLMQRFGVLSVFIVKYVYGLRTASPIFWGLAHFGYIRFALLTLASCAAWVGVLAGLGFTFATGVEKLIGDLYRIQIILLVAVIVVATVYVITRFERRVIEEEKEFFSHEPRAVEEEKEVLAQEEKD